MTRRAAIVGAGIAGLATAHHLSKVPGWEPVVFESSDSAGGVIRSEADDGYLMEAGPHTILQRNRATADLIDELGLRDEVVEPPADADKRFVVRDGRLLPAPMSLSQFLATDLLSSGAKARLLAEPLIPPRRDELDESLANFVRRRLGEEVLDYAVDPMVGGVFAGRPRLLSTRHSFEKLWRLEREGGSLAGGLLRRALTGGDSDDGPERKLLSFEEGNRRLPAALADELGEALHFGCEVVGAETDGSRWTLSFAGADPDRAPESFDRVVWAGPAHELTELELRDAEGSADLELFDEVYYPPVTVVATGIRRSRVDHPLDGFGCLVPGSEPFRILGTLFLSTLFPGRAPPGHVLLSTFVGGARAPSLTELPEDRLRQLVWNDLRELIGLRGEPELVRTFEWDRAIPQYEVGYGRILRRFDELEERFDGLHFTGSARDGIAVPDLLEAARRRASEISNGTGASP